MRAFQQTRFQISYPCFGMGIAILLGIFLGTPLNSAQAESPSKAKPNVIFIIADDLTADLACYGNPVVKTPNVDRIARGGRLFERAYCQFPICNPSRTSFLSGRRPEATGVTGNATAPKEHVKNLLLMPEYFRQIGYETAGAGKVTHTLYPQPNMFDKDLGLFSIQERSDYQKLEAQLRVRVTPESEQSGAWMAPWAVDAPDEAFPDGKISRAVAGYLSEPHDRPFFVAIGFHKPHGPWMAPAKYFEAYDPNNVRYPSAPENDLEDIPPAALAGQSTRPEKSEELTKASIAAYYANIAFLDAQVGVILDALEKSSHAERTIIVFLGDHGLHLGEHRGLWNKMTLFENVGRTPLIISVPRMKSPGVACKATVELLDVLPTLSDLCGIPAAPEWDGVSLRPALDDPSARPKECAVTVIRSRDATGRSIRTERWRFTIWDIGGGEELYDHEKDPGEFHNLAAEQELAATKEKLRRQLNEITPASWSKRLPWSSPTESSKE